MDVTRQSRRVLIVVSSFNPAMLADMQRARMLAWELPDLGWEVEVLTPRSNEVRQDVIEPDADDFFPPHVPVHEVRGCAAKLFKAIGLRNQSWRTYLPMLQRGAELLGTGRFQLVYFTTTTFVYFTLGPSWKRRFGIPYVLDFHDPWATGVAAAYRQRSWKSRLMEKLANYLEKSSVTNADGIVAVSPHYVEALLARYAASEPAWLALPRHAAIPFGALDLDLKLGGNTRDSVRPEVRIHYAGAGGQIMEKSFALICRALAQLLAGGNELAGRVRIRLYGTMYNWKEPDAKVLENVAQRFGVGQLVTELPQRISYRRSLELIQESDGMLILGVDHPGYMPSKLFTYAASGKPLLASLRRDGPALGYFRSLPALGHAMWFDDDAEMASAEALAVMRRFLEEAAARRTFDRTDVLKPLLAPSMAMRHAQLFNACVSPAVTSERSTSLAPP